MRAIGYLVFTRFKNLVKSTLKSPARLIFILVMAALLVFVIVMGRTGHDAGDEYRSIDEVYAILFGFYFVMFIISAVSGLSSGASFFTMSDVGLLFTAPVSPRRILVYGLVRQMGTTLLVSFYILFQYGWISNAYGVGVTDMAAIFLGYTLTIFCAQITAMGIYCYSSGSEGRQKAVKVLLYAFCGAVLAAAGIPALSAHDKLGAIIQSVNRTGFNYIPVVGWLRASVAGFSTGNGAMLTGGLAATAAFIVMFIAVIFRMNADYYEDVLAATEVSHSAITAKREGLLAENSPKRVKVGKAGIGRGQGAEVFFYKHLIENRRSKIFVFDTVTLIFFIITIIMALSLKGAGLISVLAFSTYMMIFSTFTGRWVKELTKPYVYLIPVSPFKKLVMLCAESVLKVAFESAVIMIPAGIIVGAGGMEIAAALFARTGFGLVFIAANFLSERIFGGLPGKMLKTIMYILTMVLLILPGIVLGVMVMVWASLSVIYAYLVMFAWSLLISAAVTFGCRNILTYAELNNQ